MRLVKKYKGDSTEVRKLGFCCMATARDLQNQRPRSLQYYQKKKIIIKKNNEHQVITKDLNFLPACWRRRDIEQQGPDGTGYSQQIRHIWIEGMNMDIKREQNDFRIHRGKYCERHSEMILEILKLRTQKFYGRRKLNIM